MSVRCCNVADETDGAEHDQWCSAFDLTAALAAAEARGYARAVQVLRPVFDAMKALNADARESLDAIERTEVIYRTDRVNAHYEVWRVVYARTAIPPHLEALTQQEGSTDGR